MAFKVLFTIEARHDLRGSYAYIAGHDSPPRADYVAREIVRAAMALRELPHRGTSIPELVHHKKPEYRQVFFKPYRIVYSVAYHSVFIVLIADGRRNLQSLLRRRLMPR